ncbi:glycoside hydrolase family 97 catalytic domain-containing protein [Streptomyces sp. SP18BB07]|nr:glycoside hydrolase family 97 catalytic domain-containing protein [Streptomyces sp. SP18BB07]MEE1758414.1 glycoside hydrolase family 97 catalytic domain-containing protein [Streptomyces sp. SP18BB07]
MNRRSVGSTWARRWAGRTRWDQVSDAAGNRVPLERIVAEADARGVKLFLWHNSGGANNTGTGTPRDLMTDAATRRAHFKKLRDLGVAGVKVDMWEADKQQLIAWQREVVEDSGRYRLHIVHRARATPPTPTNWPSPSSTSPVPVRLQRQDPHHAGRPRHLGVRLRPAHRPGPAADLRRA